MAKTVQTHRSESEEDSELAALAAQGKVRLPIGESGLTEEFFNAELPAVDRDVVGMISEDREDR